jgi:hypothetical protein
MPTQKLTAEILTAAIEGFEAQKRRIDEQIAQVRQMMNGGRSESTIAAELPRGKRRKMSAAARKRIGDAQRKRWAESKPNSLPTAPPEAPRRKRKLSAAGKRAIAVATKKRWAAFRAAKEAAKQVVAKKGDAKKTARNAAKKSLTNVAKKTASAPAVTAVAAQ